MALHDTYVRRLLAFGVSGLSVTADSLAAIKYAKVTPIRDERGIAVDFKARLGPAPFWGGVLLCVGPAGWAGPEFWGLTTWGAARAGLRCNWQAKLPRPAPRWRSLPGPLPAAGPRQSPTNAPKQRLPTSHPPNPPNLPPDPTPNPQIEGTFPKYGNDDDRVDAIATWLAQQFSNKLSQQTTYRNSVPTLSVLTITSNVVYGKKTGARRGAARGGRGEGRRRDGE
jgi:hypothetical protein